MKRLLYTAVFLFATALIYPAYAAMPAVSFSEDGNPISLKGIDLRIMHGDDRRYANPAFNDSSWEKTTLPSNWRKNGLDKNVNTAWYRFSFAMPEDPPGKTAAISLGAVEGNTTVYINNILLHPAMKRTSAAETDRIYLIPQGTLASGKQSCGSENHQRCNASLRANESGNRNRKLRRHHESLLRNGDYRSFIDNRVSVYRIVLFFISLVFQEGNAVSSVRHLLHNACTLFRRPFRYSSERIMLSICDIPCRNSGTVSVLSAVAFLCLQPL